MPTVVALLSDTIGGSVVWIGKWAPAMARFDESRRSNRSVKFPTGSIAIEYEFVHLPSAATVIESRCSPNASTARGKVVGTEWKGSVPVAFRGTSRMRTPNEPGVALPRTVTTILWAVPRTKVYGTGSRFPPEP